MVIELIVIGKTDSKEVASLVEMYARRVNFYCKFAVTALPDIRNTKNLSVKQQRTAEGEAILRQLSDGDYVVLLDERGDEMRSVEFAYWLQKRMNSGVKRLVLVIGGLIAAESMMRAYITQRVQERAEAQQRVIEAYPMVYRDLIEQYAEANNLRPAYVAAIILNESSYRTDAESSVGARGLMQLMPDTAEWIAGKLDVENYSFAMMYDAETNLRFGTWYLGYLGKLFQGDPTLVACAFHAGQGEVRGWLSDPSLSEDGVTLKLENLADGPTKSYAGRVTRDYGIYQALYFTPPAQAAGVDPLPDADSALLPLASR